MLQKRNIHPSKSLASRCGPVNQLDRYLRSAYVGTVIGHNNTLAVHIYNAVSICKSYRRAFKTPFIAVNGAATNVPMTYAFAKRSDKPLRKNLLIPPARVNNHAFYISKLTNSILPDNVPAANLRLCARIGNKKLYCDTEQIHYAENYYTAERIMIQRMLVLNYFHTTKLIKVCKV